MSEPPPPGPAGPFAEPPPPPGAGERGLDAEADPDPVATMGPWLRESLRLVGSRAGHVLPFVLFLVLVPGLLSSVALWFGVRDTIITFDSSEPLPTVQP